MSYKAAAAGLPLGGGKSVIIADSAALRGDARERLFRAHGRAVERLRGAYITAEDVGTSPADMLLVRQETRHVAGLPDQDGDPSPATAHGVFRAMQAAAEERWGSSDLARRTVAIQGCGHVGAPLARELAAAGAHLILSDVNDERAASLARELGARTIAAGEVLAAECDILAPCALGGVLDDKTIPALRAAIVCGAANNQLAQDRHGDALAARGVLYAPDYVANAGGIINGTRALLGWPAERAARAVDAIADTMALVFALARGEGVATHTAADRLAERRMAEGIPTLH